MSLELTQTHSPLVFTQSCSTLCYLMGLQPARLLCPWDSPGRNIGVGCCHSLFQGIFPTQGLNLDLLHCRWILYQLSQYILKPKLVKHIGCTNGLQKQLFIHNDFNWEFNAFLLPNVDLHESLVGCHQKKIHTIQRNRVDV